VGATDPVYLYFGLDNLGSRRVVWNADGTVKVKFNYSAWGEYTRVGGVAADEWLACFTGKEYDATGLLYFNARYYDPTTGRFLSEDPSRKGHGWYSYCDNNPISRIDPTGRQTIPSGYDARLMGSWKPEYSQKTSPAPVPTARREVAGAGASNRVPTNVLRGEELLGRQYGHYGEGYVERIPSDAPKVDCTQYIAFANDRAVVGSTEFASSSKYVYVTTPQPGDVKVWIATNPTTSEAKTHAALITGESGSRALMHSDYDHGPRYSNDYVSAEYQNQGFADIAITYFRPIP
jgi:RHS repeat-associated protein